MYGTNAVPTIIGGALMLVLSACGLARSNQIAAMSLQEMAALPDQDICQGVMFNRSNANLAAEITLYFQNQSSNSLLRIPGLVSEQLLRIWINASAGLASADGAEDRDASEQSPFGYVHPVRPVIRYRFPRVVNFPES